MSILVEHKLQIRAHKLVAYTKFTGYKFRTELQQKSAEKLAEQSINHETYSGTLKLAAKKRLAKAIDLMVQSTKRTWIPHPNKPGKKMPFQIAFTTLTVHSPNRNIDGKEAYKNLLGPMLQWLRRSQNVYLYIWKAELQQRGQIHYHLLLGNFVDQEKLRVKWNTLQAQHGYLDDYIDEHGHINAPSTEIKNALEHEDVSGYLIKEIAKSIQNQQGLNGKVWDCSMNLKEMSFYEADTNKYAGTVQNLVRQNKLIIGYSDKSCTIYKSNGFDTRHLLDNFDGYLYNDHIDFIKSTDYVKPIKEKYEPPPKPIVNFKVQYNMFLPS